MNDAPLLDADRRELAQRNLRTRRRGDEDVADLLGSLAELRLESHDEIEGALALHDLRGGAAADRGLDEPVHVGDVHAVARDLVAIDLDREARLPELLRRA